MAISIKINGERVFIPDGIAGTDYWVGTKSEWNSLTTSEKAKWDGKLVITEDDTLSGIIAPNAGSHNSLYRGKFLGNAVTATQYAAISAGTFDDMFIGDYWTINGVNWRIGGFDYWYNTGDTACTTHHVVLVPDTGLDTGRMNDTNTTDGGYVGSKMYTTDIGNSRSLVNSSFGSSHILSHRELFSNTVSSGIVTSWNWYDSTVDIMNETMVFGAEVGSKAGADRTNMNVGIDKSQLPLFALDPSRIGNSSYWWLRSVVSAVYFARVNYYGSADDDNASSPLGIRPAFAIKAS